MNPISEERGLYLCSIPTQEANVHLSLRLHRTLYPSPKTLGSMTSYPSATRTCRKQNVLCTLFYPGRFIRNLVCARWALLRRCKLQLSLSAVVSYGKGMDILAQSAFYLACTVAQPL